ncbi:MAG: hypothetical protein R3D03_01280 [Geminicoccaceae bacterium]
MTETAVRAASPGDRLRDALPVLVLSPSVAIVAIFAPAGSSSSPSISPLPTVGSFQLWLGRLHLENLFRIRAWNIAVTNLVIFGVLYIVGLLRPGSCWRSCSIRRSVPKGSSDHLPLSHALSFIVNGVAWKWFLDPGIGLEAVMRSWGWESFTFNPIKRWRGWPSTPSSSPR